MTVSGKFIAYVSFVGSLNQLSNLKAFSKKQSLKSKTFVWKMFTFPAAPSQFGAPKLDTDATFTKLMRPIAES